MLCGKIDLQRKPTRPVRRCCGCLRRRNLCDQRGLSVRNALMRLNLGLQFCHLLTASHQIADFFAGFFPFLKFAAIAPRINTAKWSPTAMACIT